MAITDVIRAEILPTSVHKVEYKIEKKLFGLLSYERKVSSQKIGEELHVMIGRIPETVLINGEEYIKG